jgi:hypothetical protein
MVFNNFIIVLGDYSWLYQSIKHLSQNGINAGPIRRLKLSIYLNVPSVEKPFFHIMPAKLADIIRDAKLLKTKRNRF